MRSATKVKQGKHAGPVLHTAAQRSGVQPSKAHGLSFNATMLLYGILLVVHGAIASVATRALAAEHSLNVEMQHALAAIRATMVELPAGPEAAVVATLAERLQAVRRENRQLTHALQQLKEEHADLIRSSRVEVARLQRAVDRSLAETPSLQSKRQALQAQLAAADPEHQLAEGATPSWHQIAIPEGSAGKATSASRPSGVKDAPAEPLNKPYTSAIDTAEPADASMSTALVAARQIVEELRQTHREALLEGLEQRFVLDVEERRFTGGQSGQFVQLDHLLSVSLLVGRPDVIDSNTGQIRFFPDGTSSGGRIQLRHGGNEAEVTVEWSNGEVSLSPAD